MDLAILVKVIDTLATKGLSVSALSVDLTNGAVLQVACIPSPWKPAKAGEEQEFDPEAPNPMLEKIMYAAGDGNG